MIIEFGSFRHRVSSAGASIDRSSVLDAFGFAYAITETWTIDFRLIGTTQQDLDAEIRALERAYAQTVYSIKLLKPDLSQTAHAITLGSTYGPLRVVKPPSYARYQNGEYVTYRTGQIVVEGLVKLESNPFRIIEFAETLEISGGGETYGLLQPNVGLAVRQRTRTNEKCVATQSGRVVHLGARGDIPPPLWPGSLSGPARIRKEPATRRGNDLYGFPTSYTYQFESAYLLNGEPTVI